MLVGWKSNFLYFLLLVYFTQFLSGADNFQLKRHDELLKFDLLSRNRRDSSVYSEYEDGVKNTGNNTLCEKIANSETQNCTITENYEETENHDYYMSHYYKKGNEYFRDLKDPSNFKEVNIEKHERLSSSYNKAFRVPIHFHFPFYGNYVDKIVVTTGGFINIGPQFHSFVHRVHYIAPLMADFNPSLKNDSVLYIGKTKNAVIVQWDNFVLHEKSNFSDTFTFQTSLHKNGTIVMAYKKIPIPLVDIKKTPGNVGVTVGFSDGFIITYRRHIKHKLVVHNLIYSYHKVNLPLFNIQNNAAYKLTLLPNCIQFTTCKGCLSESKQKTNFTCRWCPHARMCSDAMDWHRQKWMKTCAKTAFGDAKKCSSKVDDHEENVKAGKSTKIKSVENKVDVTAGVVIGVLLFLVLLLAVGVFIYAYTHPLSRPGIFLMENRRPWKRVQTSNELDDFDQLTPS